MKASIVVTVMFLSFTLSLTAHAGERTNSIQLSLGAGYVNVPDIGALNERLEPQGFDTFSENQLLTGGHVRLFIGNFIIGGESYGFSTGIKRAAQYEYMVGGGYTLVEAGYVVFSAGGLRLYPLAGIGRGNVTFTVYERGDREFNDVLSNPNQGAILSQGYLVVNVSLAADYFMKLIESGGLVFGIQAGYNQSIGTGDWTLFQSGRKTGSDVNNGPDLSITGFAGHVSVGWALLF